MASSEPSTWTLSDTARLAHRVSWTLMTLDQVELDKVDEGKLAAAVLRWTYIQTKLVWALPDKPVTAGQSVIATGNFDAETRQEFQNQVTIVDRLRP